MPDRGAIVGSSLYAHLLCDSQGHTGCPRFADGGLCLREQHFSRERRGNADVTRGSLFVPPVARG
eukprot:5900272-Pyramimonas_sp.AAC.1